MRVLEVSLRKAGFTVTTAVSVGDAIDKLEVHAPDLIISETTFPNEEADGFELRRRVRSTPEWSEIPFIFLTAEQTIENKIKGLELGVDDYLTKPIYIKEIVTRINILLQKRQRTRFEERRDGRTRFAGRVADMPVVDVIQTIEISRKSGVIQFVGDRNRQAAIYFRDGRVIDAEAGSLQGEDAVYRLLTWSEGEFEVVFRTVRRREVISTSSQGLLMEGMRRLDEWSRLLEQLPPLTHRFEVDAAELAVRLGDVPDHNNQLLRLIDGRRTLLEVIDASDVGDLECLQAISRLYFEEMLIDLDHGKAAVRRTTGQPMPLVELEHSGPTAAPGLTPIEDAASGPIPGITDEPDVELPAEPELPVRSRTRTPPPMPPPGAPVTAAPAESQAIEVTASAVLDEVTAPVEAPASVEQEAVTAPATATADDASAAERSLRASTEPPLDVTSEDIEDSEVVSEEEVDEGPTPLMGAFRPSSLRLIDEAVAAAQAIEPSLLEDETPVLVFREQPAPPQAVPQEIDAEEPVTPPPRRQRKGPSTSPVVRTERSDDSLRMIGSHGHDRAEASGELALGAITPSPSAEPARELVTIMPRRITREIPMPEGGIEAHAAAAKAAKEAAASNGTAVAPAPEAPVAEQPEVVAKPPVDPPKSPPRVEERPRIAEPRIVPTRSGPGPLAIAMMILSVILAGIAVYLRLSRKPKVADAPVIVSSNDAGTRDPIAAPPDAALVVLAVDALVVPDAPEIAVVIDAGATVDAAVAVAQIDAGVGSAGSGSAAASSYQQAKVMLEQSSAALEEGDAEKSLKLAEQSLKLHKTARGHMARATALQRLDRIDEAVEATNAAEKVSPDFSSIYEQRGRILWSARRFDEARVAFEKFLTMEKPDSKRAQAVKRLLERPQ